MASQETIGQRLKRLRLKSGLTITEAAQVLGVSPSTYREWEYGRAIRGEPYAKIAEAFHVTLSELLLGEKPAMSRAWALAEAIEDALGKLKTELGKMA